MVLDKIGQCKLLRRRRDRQTEDEKRMRSENHDAVLSLLKGSCVGTGVGFLRRSYFLLISSSSAFELRNRFRSIRRFLFFANTRERVRTEFRLPGGPLSLIRSADR